MVTKLNLETYLNSQNYPELYEKVNLNNLAHGNKLSAGILIESVIRDLISSSNYYNNVSNLPNLFRHSVFGGYEFYNPNNDRSIFEIDGMFIKDRKYVFLEVKSGKIPLTYLTGQDSKINKMDKFMSQIKLPWELLLVYDEMSNNKHKKKIDKAKKVYEKKVTFLPIHNLYYSKAKEIVYEYNKRVYEDLKKKYGSYF